jgi:hypothetical protein
MTDDKRLDLSPLDPTRNRAGFDRRVAEILTRAAPELARRRAGGSVLGQIGWWERPMLIAAAILAVVALGTLVQGHRGTSGTTAEATWSAGVGVPAGYAGWAEGGHAPSLETALGYAQEAP